VAHALLRAVPALVPTRCAAAKRREESRRGTHECVRHSTVSTVKLALMGHARPLLLSQRLGWVQPGGAARGKPARQRGYRKEERGHSGESGWIGGLDAH
jgi:hypothetical protein